jgi:catechol 2,3-dioxygenase-like lactoylglutathione lyase family enzyme
MAGELIDHIGILVPDLEAAIEKWSKVLGYEFSPIGRYRSNTYVDNSNREPHFHDTRIAFSRQAGPSIELMSITGEGTHGPAEAGVHHIAFKGIDSVPDRLAECAALGVREDGRSIMPDGSVHLAFTDKRDLDGLRLEFIAPFPRQLIADDGGPLWVDPATGRTSLWGPQGS